VAVEDDLKPAKMVGLVLDDDAVVAFQSPSCASCWGKKPHAEQLAGLRDSMGTYHSPGQKVACTLEHIQAPSCCFACDPTTERGTDIGGVDK